MSPVVGRPGVTLFVKLSGLVDFAAEIAKVYTACFILFLVVFLEFAPEFSINIRAFWNVVKANGFRNEHPIPASSVSVFHPHFLCFPCRHSPSFVFAFRQLRKTQTKLEENVAATRKKMAIPGWEDKTPEDIKVWARRRVDSRRF